MTGFMWPSCHVKSQNMERSVENPFKQGRPKWISYAKAIGIVSLFLCVVSIFDGTGRTATPATTTTTTTTTTNKDSSLLKLKTTKDVVEKTENIKPPGTIQQIDQLKQLRDGIVQEEDEGTGDDQEEEDDEPDSEDVFPLLKQDEYLPWLRNYYQSLEFKTHHKHYHIDDKKLDPPLILKSLKMGCNYIVENQIEGIGIFNYQYNFVTKQMDTSDSPVRQAGALWGLALCHNHFPSNILYKKAIENGLKFFRQHMVDGPTEGSRMIKYPNSEESQSGVNALYGLAIIDFLRTMVDYDLTHISDIDIPIEELKVQLKGTIKFLQYMQNDDLHFSKEYNFNEASKSQESSSYYDGETMLCLVKAAKYMDGYNNLIPRIEKAAPIMAKAYTIDVWRTDRHDSDKTKGFYQWSSMFFTEYYLAKWENYEYYGDYVIILAHWIIHTHGILNRKRNTG